MTAAARIASFLVALGLIFGAAALVGAAVDPLREPSGSHGSGAGHSGGHAQPAASSGAAELAGLAVADDGFRLDAAVTRIPRGQEVSFDFRILGPGGAVVTDFDVKHERRMHLIVVRRDLTGFQHLHPVMEVDGRWSARLRLPEAGAYRAYADFSAGGRSMTLATDLAVPGPFAPRSLPAPSPTGSTGGYDVALRPEGLRAGGEAELAYEVRRDGARVTDIEPYLGADGHLVALREGDLAFLHVHPEGATSPGTIRFGAELPSAGRYRLFLQFRHDGAVRTVAHTLEVAR